MAYSEDFPQASSTELMIQQLPPWMAARQNPNSNLRLYLNTIGIEIDEIAEEIDALWSKVFIGRLNPKEISWVQKSFTSIESNSSVQGVTEDNQSVVVQRVEKIRDFLRSGDEDHICLFDGQKNILYLRQRYKEVFVDGRSIELENHHIWNIFDEFALKARLRRQMLESNESLRQRTLYAFRYAQGVSAPLANFAGLFHETQWAENAPHIELDKEDVLVETIRINDRPLLPGQYSKPFVVPSILPLALEGEHQGTTQTPRSLTLRQGSSRGEFITPVLSPGNLLYWSRIEIEGDFKPGEVKIDLLSPSPDPPYSPIVSGIEEERSFDEEDGLLHPLRIRVRMRQKEMDTAPELHRIKLTYEPDVPAKVQFLYGVKTEALHDPEVKKRLQHDHEQSLRSGKRDSLLLRIARELGENVPVLWDQFVWDEGFWDIYEEGITGLEAIESPWYGVLDGISHLQPGIGFADDLLTTTREWNVISLPGSFYMGQGLQEHYLFADPVFTKKNNTAGPFLIPRGKRGAPVVVKATKGGQETYLEQVCFLDQGFVPRIQNTETVTGDGTRTLIASYGKLDVASIQVSGYTVDSSAYTGSDEIPLTEPVPVGEEVEVTYKIKDSFVIRASGDSWEVELSESFDSTTVIVENGERHRHQISTDPAKTHLTSGFLYIQPDDSTSPPHRLRMRATPLAIQADGLGRCIVVIDVMDRYDNPVYLPEDQAPALTVTGPGQVRLGGRNANRFTYYYYPPLMTADAQITLTGSLNSLSASTNIVLKKVET